MGFGPLGPCKWLLLTQAEVASNLLKPLAGIAAAIQSGIGNVAAGSWFAVCQSIGMGGAIPTGVSAVSAGLGAVIGIVGGMAGGENTIYTGSDRCPECQRRGVRFCCRWYPA